MTSAPFLRRVYTAVIIVFIVYVLQTLSPLRLVGDGIDYLLQASSAADGHGFLVHGQPSMRPPGYPFLIFVLIKAGIGHPWAIVALNCLFLGLGARGAYLLLRRSFQLGPEASSMICLLTLLSFVMVRQVTQPLSDICFFGASVWCVFFLSQVERNKSKFWLLGPAALLLILCVELRTIGVTLIAAFSWALFGGKAGLAKVPSWIRQHRIASIAACLLLSVMLVWASRIIINSRYFQFNQPTLQRRGVVESVTANLWDHTLEWGELTINAPSLKLPQVFAMPMRAIGFVAFVVCAAGFWEKRRRLSAADWYILGFSAVVLAYPWFDTRLWLPLVPLLMAYILFGLRSWLGPRFLRPVIVAHCILFSLFGLVALAYSTRLTLATPARFIDLYGDGTLRSTYRVALEGNAAADPHDVNADALYLLRRYR